MSSPAEINAAAASLAAALAESATSVWADIPHTSSPAAPEGRDFSALRGSRSSRPFGRRRPSPAPAPAAEEAAAPEEPEHGHGAEPCHHCDRPDRCDCPCVVCIGVRREVAAAVVAAAQEVIQRLGAPTSARITLDRQWENANLGGPGCPFCDATFGCSCWAERRELHQYAERQQRRADAAIIARAIAEGKCYCDQMSQNDDYPEMCDICQREEELRCRECGRLECGPECCGGCGGCSRCRGDPCKRCDAWESECCCYEQDADEESEDEDDRRARWEREYWESGH
jgi:hypothetical protein